MAEETAQELEAASFGDLTVHIDRLMCVGFGDCIDLAPSVFEFDEEGIATFRDSAGDIEREELLESCRACPVDALMVFDGDGVRIHP